MEVEARARFTLTGDVQVDIGSVVARFSKVEATAHGSFGRPERFELELAGRLADVRKLLAARGGLDPILGELGEHGDDVEASVTFLATPRQREKLELAALDVEDDTDARQLLGSEAWLGAVMSLEGYEPEKVTLTLLDGL